MHEARPGGGDDVGAVGGAGAYLLAGDGDDVPAARCVVCRVGVREGVDFCSIVCEHVDDTERGRADVDRHLARFPDVDLPDGPETARSGS